MPGLHFTRWGLCAAMIAGLFGCHSPTPQEQMQAAQSNLTSEAMALQQCEADNGYTSEKCAGERGTYDHDLAAFRTKYGR
jgi:hypothetical protein